MESEDSLPEGQQVFEVWEEIGDGGEGRGAEGSEELWRKVQVEKQEVVEEIGERTDEEVSTGLYRVKKSGPTLSMPFRYLIARIWGKRSCSFKSQLSIRLLRKVCFLCMLASGL